MNPAAELKAAGRLGKISLKDLNNASIPSSELAVLSDRFCMTPDYVDREIVETEPDVLAKRLGGYFETTSVIAADGTECRTCDAIQGMHRRMAEATGRGSWPPGKRCHPSIYPHEGYHATLLYIEPENFLRNSSLHREVTEEEWREVVVKAKVWPSVKTPVSSVEDAKRVFSYDSQDPVVRWIEKSWWRERSDRLAGQPFTVLDMSTWLALETTRRAGCLYMEVDTGSSGQHNVHEKMIAIPGGTSGFAYFPDGTCGDHVTSNIDSTLVYSLGRVTGLRAHEFGHTLQLYHEFRAPQSGHRSVLSYNQDNTPYFGYRLAENPYWVNTPGNLVEDHSWDDLRRLFGGEAALPIEGTAPPPPPPPVGNTLTGELIGEIVDANGDPVPTELLVAIRGELLVNGRDPFIMRAKTEEGGAYEPFPKPR